MSATPPVDVERFTYTKKDVLGLVEMYKANDHAGIHRITRCVLSFTAQRHPRVQWYEMAEAIHAMNHQQEVDSFYPAEVLDWMREGLNT